LGKEIKFVWITFIDDFCARDKRGKDSGLSKAHAFYDYKVAEINVDYCDICLKSCNVLILYVYFSSSSSEI